MSNPFAIIEDVWTRGAHVFMNVEHLSQARMLHPEVASNINAAAGHRVLDYGCGDGRLLRLLRKDLEIDIYDTSPAMLELAQSRVGSRISRVLRTPDDIQAAHYDIVILSMVLVCIETAEEFGRVLDRCCRALRPGGLCVIAVTHPCFRQYAFSNIRTSYTDQQQSFHYRRDGKPFTVTIQDDRSPAVTFVDYHWSLSFTVNAIAAAGLRITSMVETPDNDVQVNSNPFVPLFLLLTCTPL